MGELLHCGRFTGKNISAILNQFALALRAFKSSPPMGAMPAQRNTGLAFFSTMIRFQWRSGRHRSMFLDEMDSYDRMHAIDRMNAGCFMKRSRVAETEKEKESKAPKRRARAKYRQAAKSRDRIREIRCNAR